MQYLQTDSIHQWTDGDYEVTSDPARVDFEVVYRFLSQESYWAQGRARELIECAVRASRPYSLYHAPSSEHVGFARVLTDGTWFGWIGDVFVLPEHRGSRGKFLLSCIMQDLVPVRRVALETRDAHGLYAQFGFAPLVHLEIRMERRSF
jgi:hypothetical protein